MDYGFYQVSWAESGTDPHIRQRTDLTRAANAGCTVLHMSHLQDVGRTRSLLNLAQSRGVGLILEDLVGADLEELQAHPALRFHSIRDDANVPRLVNGVRQTEAESLTALQAACDASPAARRYISIAGSFADAERACYGRSEAIGFQTYPWPDDGGLPTSWRLLSQARQIADAHGQLLYANLQTYDNGSGYPPTVWVRGQAWVAAAAGVDGMLAYAMLDQNGVVPQDVFTAFCRAGAEIRGLTSGRARAAWVEGNVLHAQWNSVRAQVDLPTGNVSLTLR